MAWDKLKSLFVVRQQGATPAAAEISEKELLAWEVPQGQDLGPPPLPADAVAAQPGGAIDFQALYDQAGIPNTDEVEALEKFLGGLDADLPQTSKVAAAKAFLGAIGKKPSDVLEDAGRKIQVVRIVEEAKKHDGQNVIAQQQSAIDSLQKQIEEHRAAIESVRRELESVRAQCAAEEGRLQGARAFFGHMGQVPPPGPPMAK